MTRVESSLYDWVIDAEIDEDAADMIAKSAMNRDRIDIVFEDKCFLVKSR